MKPPSALGRRIPAAIVTSTNFSSTATVTANPPSGGFITIVNVTFGGNGYTTAPTVTITGGGGSGATATATISLVGGIDPATQRESDNACSEPGTCPGASPPHEPRTTFCLDFLRK